MVDHEEDTKAWTKEYVTSNRKVCLLYLREVNLLTANYIKEGKYYAAYICLHNFLYGLMAMHMSKEYGDLRSYLSIYSCSAGELAAFADPAGMLDEQKESGQTWLTLSQFSKNMRDIAVADFEDARGFAKSDDLKQSTASMAKDLKAGITTDQVRRDYAPDFPEDVCYSLLEMDSRFFVPQLCRCAPDECLYLDKERLLFTDNLDPQAALSRSAKPSRVSSGGKRGKKSVQDFNEWMESNGVSEEDLEWAYKRVKSRRNLYGILLLIPPLGPVLLPFWLRAVYLTKAFYYRDYGVDFNFFQYLVLFFYGLPTLFIYPIVMGFIIRSTDWGMGLRSKSARVLSIIVLLIFASALIYTLASEGMFHEMADKAAELPKKATAILPRPAEDNSMGAALQEADGVYSDFDEKQITSAATESGNSIHSQPPETASPSQEADSAQIREPDYENKSDAWAYATLASSGDNSVEALVLRELTENGGWSKYFDGTNSDVWLKEYPTSSSRVRQTAKITTGREFELFISDNANAYLSRAGAINQNMTAYDMAVAEYSQSIFDRMHSELDWLGAGTALDSTVQTINGNSWYVYSGSNSGNGTQDCFYVFFFMDAAQEIAAEVSFEYLLYSGASSADANFFNEWYLNLSDSLLIH